MIEGKFYYLLTVGILSLFMTFGCSSREPLLDRALIPTDAAPHISNISPDENLNNVPINTLIHIEFPDPMDTDSVENNTYLKYDDTIIDKSNLSFTWDTTKTLLTIDPLIDLPPGTEITVIIETGAVNQQGIHLIETFTCTFTTTTSDQPDTTSPTIIAFNPSSLQVTDTEVQIQVTFSEEMSHISVEKTFILASTDNQEIYTHTNGSFSWNGTTMIFTPESSLSMDKEYIISFSTSTDIVPQDLAGNPLTGSTSSRFYTLENKIYVSPTNGDDNNPGYHKTLPVKTIARGIQRAVTYGYDLVKIEEGIYTETINLGSQEGGITIEGAYVSGTNFNSRDIDNKPTIIQSPTSEYSITTSDTSNIKFDGVLIKGGIAGGIKIQNCSNVTLIYCTIYGSETTANSAEGLIASDSNSINIIDSTIYGANGASITGDVYGIKASSSSVSVSSSTISALEAGASSSGTSYGIYIDNISNTTASLTIQNSSINTGGSGGDSTSYGIYGDGTSLTITGSSIYGGNSSGGDTYGIYILNSTNIDISNNPSIKSGDSSDTSAGSFGIYISNSSNISIEGNSQIEGNTSGTPSSSLGIYITGSNTGTISGNTISGGNASSSTIGINIDGNSTSITISNNSITGGGANSNYGIYVSGGSQCNINYNQSIIGGTAGTVYGIYIDNSTATVENNNNIFAGTTASNPSYGIFITNSASTIIRDNTYINGGENTNANTFGLYIDGVSDADIYRNTVVGGDENTSTRYNNYGIYIDSAMNINIFNNFIIGATSDTDSSNYSYGIYSFGTNVKVVNNTITAGGVDTAGSSEYYSIYLDSIPTWGIKPEILNNIIIGGNDSSSSYGIFINNQIDPSPEDWCVIFNNAFDKSRCQIYVRTDSDTYSSINAFQTAGDILPDPINNDAYNITGIDTDIRFLDPSNYNYRIDPASPDTSFISDKGYNDTAGNPNYQAADIYSPSEAALYDIDGEARPTDYSNIDLGADEFN